MCMRAQLLTDTISTQDTVISTAAKYCTMCSNDRKAAAFQKVFGFTNSQDAEAPQSAEPGKMQASRALTCISLAS